MASEGAGLPCLCSLLPAEAHLPLRCPAQVRCPTVSLNEDTNIPLIGLERPLDSKDTASLPTGDGHLCEHLSVTSLRPIIQQSNFLMEAREQSQVLVPFKLPQPYVGHR